jgi:RHS repeat-associated protein
MTDSAAPDKNANKTNHYDGSGDSPSWVDENNLAGPDGKPTAYTRYLPGLDGNLAVTETATGGYTYQLANLHGDITARIKATTTSGPETYLAADEFGNDQPLTATTGLPTVGDPGDNKRYGWLGGKQRSNETAGNLLLMGVRLYSPTLGRFLQTDPVEGGSDNAYGYPTDPLGMSDLDGRRWGWLRHAAKWGGVIAAGACIVATAGACAVITLGAVGLSLANNAERWRSGEVSGRGALRDSALDVAFGRFKAARLKWSYISRYRRGTRLVSHESLASAYRALRGGG